MNGTISLQNQMNLTQPAPPFLSTEDIDLLKRTMVKGFTVEEQDSFIRTCQRALLDPFSKQIYATRRYTKNRDGTKSPTLVIVTSVLGLTAIAARTGYYKGCKISWAGKWEQENTKWYDAWLGDDYPIAARAVVQHAQRSIDEVGIARWNGYAGTYYDAVSKKYELSDFWARLPDFMLGKCAKAQALRGAFPDQCANIYIREELDTGISETDEPDETTKIAENQQRSAELMKEAGPGIRIVESHGPTPTPAEAAEPAFPEDALPPRPVAAPAAAPVQVKAEAPDDLDMEPPAESPPTESAKPWASHIIIGLKNEAYKGRTIGELSVAELQAVETNWIPKVRAVWDKVNPAQKADVEAFEAAIAYYKMERPW